jgi:hypothetical protein
MIGVKDWSGFFIDDFADFKESGGMTDFSTPYPCAFGPGLYEFIVADDCIVVDEVADLCRKVVETQRLGRHLSGVSNQLVVNKGDSSVGMDVRW